MLRRRFLHETLEPTSSTEKTSIDSENNVEDETTTTTQFDQKNSVDEITSGNFQMEQPMAKQEMVETAFYQLNELKQDFIVLIAGARKVGKSTFGRTLLNGFLDQNLPVYHLECDPGQTEFTPPGCLALTEIVDKVDGLPFTHLRTPLSCRFFGEPSPSNRIDEYILCVQQLMLDFQRITSETSPSCLVVNSCGWIHGAGLGALREICRTTKPNSVCLLGPSSKNDKTTNQKTKGAYEVICSMLAEIALTADPTDPASFCVCVRGSKNANHLKLSPFSPPELREAALLSYFGGRLRYRPRQKEMESAMLELSTSICVTAPYAVPMNQFYINVVHNVPPPSYILSIFNASLIALCRYEKRDENEDVKHWMDDPTLPMILEEGVSNIQCLGYGVIRATNMDERIFYVVTPLPRDVLAQVNTFLKGDISLPSAVFNCQEQFYFGDGGSLELPYVVQGRESLELDDDQLVLCAFDEERGRSRNKKKRQLQMEQVEKEVKSTKKAKKQSTKQSKMQAKKLVAKSTKIAKRAAKYQAHKALKLTKKQRQKEKKKLEAEEIVFLGEVKKSRKQQLREQRRRMEMEMEPMVGKMKKKKNRGVVDLETTTDHSAAGVSTVPLICID